MKLSTHAKKKIQRKKKGQWRCFGFDACQKKSKGKKGTMEIFFCFDIVSSIIVTKREKEREMKLGPTVQQGTNIEIEI